MSLLTVTELRKTYGLQEVLRGVSFVVAPGRNVGLVGPNGAGKTTLLRIVAGLETADGGHVKLAANATVALLAQEPHAGDARNILEAARRPTDALQAAWHELSESERALAGAGGAAVEGAVARHDAAHHRYQDLRGYECEHRAPEVLAGLGFPQSTWEQPVASLSGGEKTRLALAQILVLGADLLLLDEPTNHLDWDACEWLQEYLRRSSSAALIASHDRYFLDETAGEIVALEAGRVERAQGNYAHYLRVKAEREAQAELAYQRRQREVARQEAIVQRLLSHRKHKSMQARKRVLEELQPVERPRSDREMRVNTRAATPATGRVALEARGLTFGYGERNLFSGLDFTLERGDRLGIVGPNGAGKSTLLRCVAGELKPAAGRVTLGHMARFGYFSQHRDDLPPEETVLETVLAEATTIEQAHRTLRQFLFTEEDLEKRVADLSGGEKTRLALLRLLLRNPNVLLLDEPTNHLDIPAREAVEEGLKQYPGALLFVTHDRYLLEALAGRTLELREGRHRFLDGGYRRYREQRAARPAVRAPAAPPKPSTQPKEIQKEVRRLEREIAAAEARLEELTAALADPATYQGSAAAELSREFEELTARAERLYEEWSAAAERLPQPGRQ